MDFNRIDGAGSPGSPSAYEWTQEDHDLFSRVMNEAGPSSSAEPDKTVYDVSWAVPEMFSHGSQVAPLRMIEKLTHHGLLPDSEQPTMSYEIRGHLYTAALDPSQSVRLIHNPPEAQMPRLGSTGAPDFGAFFIETRRGRVPRPEQWAPLALIEKLREHGLMPTADHPTTISLGSKLYNAELKEGGFVRLTRRQT
ncbi:hypothetical protein GWE18_31265 [Bradyrhizobium sp. CSA112]|uniref:hypothetical protein n=1 Tax=Bradyrhizobium sp. CSA112 TaxID=2699170 RepID=UPI0023AF40AF|nr:hypothetical protein [Bradyrhizobium sp. CSA112]MDE5457224.1 hypothetical protein [Bradyrhizobium sp. CSA112]